MNSKIKIAVFASGQGSNLQSLYYAIEQGIIKNGQIVCVISNNSDSGALSFANEKNIPAYHVSQKQFNENSEFVKKILNILKQHKSNLIVLAGYMKLLDAVIVNKFKNRILNIHPALLPDFGGKGMYGANVHKAVIESGSKISGATVHLVDEIYDHGSIILQKTVNIDENETPESLAEKVLEIEHKLLPEAVRLFIEEKVIINGDKLIIKKNGKDAQFS